MSSTGVDPSDRLVTEALVASSDDEYDRAVAQLKQCANDGTFERLASLASSERAIERVLAADVLAEFGLGQRFRLHETKQILLKMIRQESDPSVLEAICWALSHTPVSEAGPILVTLSSHADRSIRKAVTQALAEIANEENVGALLELMMDSDEEVRDWATFAVGSLTDIDTPEVRSALRRATSDGSISVRYEGMMGLAKRGDCWISDRLLKELESDDVEAWVLEVAAELGDSRLLSSLQRIQSTQISNQEFAHELKHAIARCGK